MKKLVVLATAVLGGTTAFAHESSTPHVHPHGFELIALGLLVGAGVLGAVKLGWIRIRKDQ